jgi:hypothetical protein
MSEPPSEGDKNVPPPPQPEAVRAGLASLPLTEATDEFWSHLEGELEEEAPLQLTPRPAIRPITQPPPAAGGQASSDDVFERGGHRRSVVGRRLGGLSSFVGGGSSRSGSSRTRLVAIAVLAGIVGLAALGGMVRGDDDDPVETTGRDSEVPDDAAEAPADDEAEDPEAAEEPEETTTTTTIPKPRGMEPDTPLRAGGVGLLETGTMTLADVASVTGIEPEVNQDAFSFSDGRCFDAVLPGADDVTLWFRSNEGEASDDATRGVLSAISIGGSSERKTDAGFGVGTADLQLAAHYEWRLQDYPNPFHPQGAILVAQDENSDNAIGYVSGNGQVLEVRVGHEPLVSRPDLCQL